MPVDNEPMLTVGDVARELSVSIKTIRRMIKAKKIHASVINFQYRIDRSEVDRLRSRQSQDQDQKGQE